MAYVMNPVSASIYKWIKVSLGSGNFMDVINILWEADYITTLA